MRRPAPSSSGDPVAIPYAGDVTASTSAGMCSRYRALHESGTFVLPNPWDAGSLHLLVHLGFQAVATTSSGWAWSRAARDNGLSLEDALTHLREMADASPVPVNGDFEGGFAVEPVGVATNVVRAADTGVAGVSIEDATGDPDQPLFEFALAVERIRAARSALDAAGSRVVLTARTEGFIVGRPDLAETLRRLEAFADAGADCLYAPGIRTREQIAAVVKAVSPRPVNVLVGGGFTTVEELAALGVRRISVGGALARAAWTGFMQAAREIAEGGTFGRLGEAIPYAEVNGWFPDR